MERKINQVVKQLGLTVGVLFFAVAAFVSFSASALDRNSNDPRKIAEAVENRDIGDKQVSRIAMVLKDNTGRTRERVLRSRSMKFSGGTKTLMLFESPADVRNTGFLSIEYDSGNKTDDQWLYLPSLRKSTRIASSDRSGSFMGTDISYADMTKKDINKYDYKMVKQSEMINGEDCWVIESKPKNQKEVKETGYVKSLSWISKSKLMPLQIKSWVKEGRKIKYIKFGGLKQVNGIWIAQKTSVRTMRSNKVESTTIMRITSVKFGESSVKEGDFTERRLSKGLY